MKNKVDGILVVDKPMDWTSYDVVNCVKRRFNVEKVGHCGTLDPIATGLLVILLGKATKFQDQFMGQDKVYAATMRLGVETDSEDRTGQVIATADCSAVTEASQVSIGVAVSRCMPRNMAIRSRQPRKP